MMKWFEEKFEKNRLRKYSQKRLSRNPFDNFFRTFSVSNWIILTNIIVYILVFILMQFIDQNKLLHSIALQANNFFSGTYWTLLTSMFVHFEIWHILANMVSLFFIGSFIEKIIGRKRLFWLYIFSGIFAGLFYVFSAYFLGYGIGAKIFGSPETYAIGASGAIFSLLGLLAVLTPKNKVYLIAGPIFAIILQAVITSIFPSSSLMSVLNIVVSVYILFSIFSVFSFNPRIARISLPIRMSFWLLPIIAIVPLVLIGLFVDLPIGNSAHFGGLIIGIIYGFYLKNKYKKKTALISRYFSG